MVLFGMLEQTTFHLWYDTISRWTKLTSSGPRVEPWDAPLAQHTFFFFLYSSQLKIRHPVRDQTCLASEITVCKGARKILARNEWCTAIPKHNANFVSGTDEGEETTYKHNKIWLAALKISVYWPWSSLPDNLRFLSSLPRIILTETEGIGFHIEIVQYTHTGTGKEKQLAVYTRGSRRLFKVDGKSGCVIFAIRSQFTNWQSEVSVSGEVVDPRRSAYNGQVHSFHGKEKWWGVMRGDFSVK